MIAFVQESVASRYELIAPVNRATATNGRPVSRALRPLPWQWLRLRQYWRRDPHTSGLMSICTIDDRGETLASTGSNQIGWRPAHKWESSLGRLCGCVFIRNANIANNGSTAS